MLELLIISFLFSKWLYTHCAECSVLKESLVFRVFEIPLNATVITLVAMLIDRVKVVVDDVYRGRNNAGFQRDLVVTSVQPVTPRVAVGLGTFCSCLSDPPSREVSVLVEELLLLPARRPWSGSVTSHRTLRPLLDLRFEEKPGIQ